MKTVGIIVEYNPLHNGHVYHFQQSKIVSGAQAVVAVMSGHFLQRGEPAVVNKWARAEMALHMGADLVLELPVAYSAQPAEWFAYGAVSALGATGVVDALCFGSESGRLDELRAIAGKLYAADLHFASGAGGFGETKDAFAEQVRMELKRGASYPAAYAAAAGEVMDPEIVACLAEPNNSLGIHYLLALLRLQSPIEPLTIRRQKAGYNQETITDERIASATAIRKLLSGSGSLEDAKPYIPAYTLDIMRRELEAGRGPIRWDDLYRPLLSRLIVTSPEDLSGLAEVTEGLEFRIKRAAAAVDPAQGQPFEQLLTVLKTKRYTRAKLQRMLLRILLNHKKDKIAPDQLKLGVPYLRVLGFTERGRALLKEMRKSANVPVVSRTAAYDHPFLRMDSEATAIYALAYPNPSERDLLRDYTEPPIQM